MTPEEAAQIIDATLGKVGEPQPQDESYFLDARFNSIPWLPTYSRRMGNRVWAIELYRGDRAPETTLQAMVKIATVDPTVQAAFFVPANERYDHLLPACRINGIALIVKVADEYEALIFPAADSVFAEPLIVRIPEWVVDRLFSLQRLAPAFQSALIAFARRYRQLLKSGRANDETQERLLRNTFLSLLGADQRFAAVQTPLDLLRFFEQSDPQPTSRDHYFHTFINFLLGCIAIDDSYPHFLTFSRTCFPGMRNWSIEYVWLLTVFFHDVGYPIQRRQQTAEIIFGVSAINEEQIASELKQVWESPTYLSSRAQLVSLYEHLTQPTIDSHWIADPFPMHKGHALDKAFELSFLNLKHGHGVASCMRMLADFYRFPPGSAKQRQFLAQHIFASGLSIPFHDWPVRKCLRSEGISEIRTSRFPFAALLMFVDSIQEDRRGKSQDPDVLTGISFVDDILTAQMNLNLLPPEKLAEKKRDVADVVAFLKADALRFRYPAALSG